MEIVRNIRRSDNIRRVARRMAFNTCVAGSFTGLDFCLIFAP
jgi:hypothetical protein